VVVLLVSDGVNNDDNDEANDEAADCIDCCSDVNDDVSDDSNDDANCCNSEPKLANGLVLLDLLDLLLELLEPLPELLLPSPYDEELLEYDHHVRYLLCKLVLLEPEEPLGCADSLLGAFLDV
jgi:hypothetical protein